MQKLIASLKKHKAIFVISSMSLIVVCCKSTVSTTSGSGIIKAKPTLVPDSSDVLVANTRWTGTTLASLAQGYALFTDKCTQCHGMKKPQDFSVDDWNNIYPGMSRKAHLDSLQDSQVYHYILTKRETMLR